VECLGYQYGLTLSATRKEAIGRRCFREGSVALFLLLC